MKEEAKGDWRELWEKRKRETEERNWENIVKIGEIGGRRGRGRSRKMTLDGLKQGRGEYHG